MSAKFRLGAEELIELGRGEASKEPQKPFFLGRVRLSDAREGGLDYVGARFREELSVLERLSGSSTLPEAIRRAPIVREVVAETLVLGRATLHALGAGQQHALGHVLEALEASGTPDENGALLEAAAARVAVGAPAQVRPEVEKILGVG